MGYNRINLYASLKHEYFISLIDQSKTIMKNIFLSILLLTSFSAFTQTTTIRLASDVWPPFTDVDGEKALAMDLVKEALSRIGIKTSFEILEFNDVLDNIDAGEFDGSAALWLSDEREKKYLYSESYLQNQLILVGRKGSDVSATSFTDFSKKRIGIIADYAYGVEINPDSVSLVNGINDQQNLERLLSEQIDYMLVDALLIQYLLKYQVNDVTEYLEIGTAPIMIKSLHFVLRKDVVGAQEIITQFNEEIHQMIAEGTYNKILELNWIRADMDGDGTMELILEGDIAGTAPPQYTYGVYSNQSLVKKADSPERFYIKGKMYNSWDQVPQEYKTDMVMNAQSAESTGIKLDF